jgi:hypothetical protein
MCEFLFAGSWISELRPDHELHVQNLRISLCANDRGNRGFQRSVGSFQGTPCAEEPSLATWQKYGAGNSVIIDIDIDIDIDILV